MNQKVAYTLAVAAASVLIGGASTLLAQSASARPADIITSISSKVVAPVTANAEARKLGRYVYDKPTPQNSVMLFVDHQVGLISGVRDFQSLSEYKNNVVALAKFAKALKIPVLLTSSNAQWQNGDLLPELKAVFPNEPIYRRTGIINAYEDPTFRKALQDIATKSGRTHVIISGVTLGTCVAMPTLSMLQDGFRVYPVIDASGTWGRYEADATIARVSQAGAEPVAVFALAAELQGDWKNESANDMLAPFVEHLPEYGMVVQNFWNNANVKQIPDPFGIVKSPAPASK